MRAFRSTLVFLVLFLGLGAYVYFVEMKRPAADDAAIQKPKVFSIEADNVEEIQLKPAAGETATVRKGTDGWTIVEPIQTPADENVARDMATNLATLEQDRIVDENASDLKSYGLEPPRFDVTFRLAGEKDPRRVLLGDKNATNTGLYAKLPSDTRVFLVATFLETTFGKSAFDLRDKTILKFERDKVDSLELASKGGAIQLTKSGTDWKLVKPVQAPADFTAVEGVLGQLQSAQMLAVESAEATDLRKYGLDRPEVTATVGAGSTRAVLQIGAKADDQGFFARDVSKPVVFRVSTTVADELRKTAFDMRRKEIFEFREFNATRFEITRGTQTRAFERAKSDKPTEPDVWKQVAPAAQNIDSGTLSGVLTDFSNMRAEAFVDTPGSATGLKSPFAVITIKFDDGKKEERVRFGRFGDDVFAERPDSPGALKVEMGKFDEAIKKLDAIK